MTEVTRSEGTTRPGVDWVHRRRDIQGLRAVAVLAVIAYHAELPIPGGFTGVDIFFVISGFVITQLILRRHNAGTFSYRDFYARRAQRLLPALAVMVTAVFLCSFLLQSPFGAQQQTAQTGIGAMLLSANLVIIRFIGGYFSPAAESNPLLHTWSLSVEEQFYLLFPLVLLVGIIWIPKWLRRSSQTRRPVVTSVIIISALSFSINLAWSFGVEPLSLTSQPQTWAFYQAPARAWEFGIGALVALLVSTGSSNGIQRLSGPLAALGSALVLLGFWLITPQVVFPGLWALLPVTGTALIIAAGQSTNPISRSLGILPMVKVGDWSYSLYLWHWPAIVFLVLVWDSNWAPIVAVTAAVIPALLSYRFVEEPTRRRSIPRKTVLVLGLCTALFVIALGLLLLCVGSRLMPAVAALEGERRVPTTSEAAGCFLPARLDAAKDLPRLQESCWFGNESRDQWILLVGDSHASHASTGLVQAARALDLPVFSITGGACPFQSGPVTYSDLDACNELNTYLWTLIESENPPLVVVVASRGVPADSKQTLSRLTREGIPVIWLRNVPRWSPADQGIQHLPCRGGALNFDCTFTESEVETYQSVVRLQEEELKSAFPDTYFIDPRDLFCSEEICSPIQEGRLMYVDNEHLNYRGSALLTDSFASQLRRILQIS